MLIVLLTTLKTGQTHSNEGNGNTNGNNGGNQRSFDPSQQKSFLLNSILDRESKQKQQIERSSLLDELIKETEKKSKITSLSHNSILSTLFANNAAANFSSSSLSAAALSSDQKSVQQSILKQMNIVDLNDIYCHFPEMCTHHLKEVEDFTFMCCQLFQLEETIKSQKQLLSTLEFDLQRELNQNANVNGGGVNGAGSCSESSHSQTLNAATNGNLSSALQQITNSQTTNATGSAAADSPEIDQFRKEVNMR